MYSTISKSTLLADDYALFSMLSSISRPRETLTHLFLRKDLPHTSMDISHHLGKEGREIQEYDYLCNASTITMHDTHHCCRLGAVSNRTCQSSVGASAALHADTLRHAVY